MQKALDRAEEKGVPINRVDMEYLHTRPITWNSPRWRYDRQPAAGATVRKASMPFVKRHRAGDQMPKVVIPAGAGIGQTLDWGSCLETSEPP